MAGAEHRLERVCPWPAHRAEIYKPFPFNKLGQDWLLRPCSPMAFFGSKRAHGMPIDASGNPGRAPGMHHHH